MTQGQLKGFSKILGTPSYIFDEDEFAARVRLVRQCFTEKTGLCFSVKANPFLLGSLPEEIDKIEVCSPGELSICEDTGADMQKVIYSGVNKGMADVDRAIKDGVGTFTAESYKHLELINRCALNRGVRVPLLLRLTGGSQFGMDEEALMDIISNRNRYPGVEISGLHYFTGTQKRKPEAIIKELDLIERFSERVKSELGFTLERVEYGTGLAVDYFSQNADEDEKQRLLAISDSVRALAQRTSLTVEMGRFFAAPCGYYLTSVVDTKTNMGVNYAICDGGLNQLKYDGQIQGMQIPEIIHIKPENKSGEKALWTLCGSLCTTADVLARNAELSDLETGDALVFCRTGAYSVTEGMAAFLSREMPKVALYSEKQGLRTVRDFIYSHGLNTPRII